MVNAADSNLLRIALSKSSKDTGVQQQPSMKLPSDSNKLEKQFKSLVSKFENGATLLSSVYIKNGNTIKRAFITVPGNRPFFT